MKEEDILSALKYAKELPSLENRLQQTKKSLKILKVTRITARLNCLF
jgi:hypothetical protein